MEGTNMEEPSKFNKYNIRYNTDSKKEENPLAEIICLTTNNIRVAYIHFWKDKPLKENYVETTQFKERIIHINFDISRFNDIIQMLQYKEPITVEYDDSTKLGVLLLENIQLQKGQK
jgi:hypothetical protein